MGIFDIFRKKSSFEEEMGFPEEPLPKLDEMPGPEEGGHFGAEKRTGGTGFGSNESGGYFGDARRGQFQESSASQYQGVQKDISKDIEIISAKLDTIKALVESMNHRLKNIEDLAYGETEKSKKQW